MTSAFPAAGTSTTSTGETVACDNHIIQQCLAEQLLEIELLQSIYSDEGEFQLDESTQLESIQNWLSDSAVVTDSNSRGFLKDSNSKASKVSSLLIGRIGFTLSLNVRAGISISILCQLPHTYPLLLPPQMTLSSIGLGREPSQSLSQSLQSYISDNYCQESMLYQVFMWLAEYCRDLFSSSQQTTSVSIAASSSQRDTDRPFTRIWLYSHHIYNKNKRRDILAWSKDLRLTGFCIPGKPGIICAEGQLSCTEEFWQRLRRLTWKKLMMKERETCPTEVSISAFRQFVSFEEMNFEGKTGRGREIHMDWGLVIKFFEEHNFHNIIPLYFGDIV